MIEVQDLRKSYPAARGGRVLAVDGVSFFAGPGEIVGLLGPNGAGKSTTMRMLATLIAPDSGSARIAGFDVVDAAADVRRSVGYLSATTGLYGRLTAREVLVYTARLQGCRDAIDRAEAQVEAFEMGPWADLLCEQLSTGMKQKVNIARALVHDPPILIFDEPTLGLDVIVAQHLFGVLERARAAGRCVLYSTHVMGEAERLCDRVAVIHRGRVVASGSPEELRALGTDGRLEGAFMAIVSRSEA